VGKTNFHVKFISKLTNSLNYKETSPEFVPGRRVEKIIGKTQPNRKVYLRECRSEA
jgi:hypothetical protein